MKKTVATSRSSYNTDDWSYYSEAYFIMDSAGTKNELNELISTTLFRTIQQQFPTTLTINALELGCGPGGVINTILNELKANKNLTKETITLTGVDNLKAFVTFAKNKFSDSQNTCFYHGDITDETLGLPVSLFNTYQDNKIHVIILSNSFYCLNEKAQKKLLRLLKTILHPSGFILLNDPSRIPTLEDKTIRLPQGMIRTMGKEQATQFFKDHEKENEIIRNFHSHRIQKYNFRNYQDQIAFVTSQGYKLQSSLKSTYCTLCYLLVLTLPSIKVPDSYV